MSITVLDCSPDELAHAIARVLAERDEIKMEVPELLLKLRRAGGLFSFFSWPEEAPGGPTEGR
jgi:hypothetical protein